MSLLIQLLIGIVPAIISGLVAYFKAKNDAKVKILEVEKNAEIEVKRIEEENKSRIRQLQEERKADLKLYEGKLEADSKKSEKDYIYNFTSQMIDKMMNDENFDFEQIENMKKFADRLNE